MTKIIWMISFISALLGMVTMCIPSKHAYILTWATFVTAVLGVIILLILMYGGPIYL